MAPGRYWLPRSVISPPDPPTLSQENMWGNATAPQADSCCPVGGRLLGPAAGEPHAPGIPLHHPAPPRNQPCLRGWPGGGTCLGSLSVPRVGRYTDPGGGHGRKWRGGGGVGDPLSVTEQSGDALSQRLASSWLHQSPHTLASSGDAGGTATRRLRSPNRRLSCLPLCPRFNFTSFSCCSHPSNYECTKRFADPMTLPRGKNDGCDEDHHSPMAKLSSAHLLALCGLQRWRLGWCLSSQGRWPCSPCSCPQLVLSWR